MATPHMFYMQGVIFCKQHSLATKIGFLEVPYELHRPVAMYGASLRQTEGKNKPEPVAVNQD